MPKRKQKQNKNVCFICLENKGQIIKLKSLKQLCDCDSFVHKKCVAKWYSFSPNCPICRKSIHEVAESYFDIYIEQDPGLVEIEPIVRQYRFQTRVIDFIVNYNLGYALHVIFSFFCVTCIVYILEVKMSYTISDEFVDII
jgi:hypothetical protein